jgi:hypothetical protein
MITKRKWLVALMALSVFSLAQAQSDSGSGGRVILPEGITLRPHGYGHFEAGQIAQGSIKQADKDVNVSNTFKLDHIWTEDACIELGFDAAYRERLKLAFSLGAKLYFSFPVPSQNAGYTKNLRQDIYFNDLNAQYYFGDATSPWLLAQVGYFKYKYNPDVRNLGEYMFQTGTYPIWFDMTFDRPWQRLLGLHFQSNLFHSLKLDLLFVSATVVPAMNWSLAALANYDIAAFKFIEIGAGVDFAHLFSVYTDHTMPDFGGDLTTPSTYRTNSKYIDENGDTNWYTFKGTKIMGRLSINPMKFVPQEIGGWKIFGEKDLKLYGEADIIGLKSYPDSGITVDGGKLDYIAPSYNKWYEKMPVSIGLNLWTDPVFTYGIAPELLLWFLDQKYNVNTQLPTTVGCLLSGVALSWLEKQFKLDSRFDVLNLEVEWFGAKYKNDPTNFINKGAKPLPNDVSLLDDPSMPKKSQYKWSLYAKKSFCNGHFAVTGQVGRDHMRLSCASYNDELWNELLVEDNDWWWVLKTSWMF